MSKDTLRKIKYPDGIAFPSFNRRQPSGKGSSANLVTEDTRRKPYKSQKGKRDKPGKKPARHEAHQSQHESPSSAHSSDESDAAETHFANIYNTIDVRNRKYDSYSSLLSGDEESASIPRSATTQAKKK